MAHLELELYSSLYAYHHCNTMIFVAAWDKGSSEGLGLSDLTI